MRQVFLTVEWNLVSRVDLIELVENGTLNVTFLLVRHSKFLEIHISFCSLHGMLKHFKLLYK